MTFTSCSVRPVFPSDSVSRWVCRIVSTWVARTIRWRIEYEESARTNSVFSSGSRGSRVSTPTTSSTPGSPSRCCAMRLPQIGPEPGDEDAPAAHRRRSSEPDALALAEHVVDRVLDGVADRVRLLHHRAAVVAGLVACATSKCTGGSTRSRNFAGSGTTRPRSGPNTSMFAVSGAYGHAQQLREALALRRGSASPPRCRRWPSARRARRRAWRSRRSRRARSGAER